MDAEIQQKPYAMNSWIMSKMHAFWLTVLEENFLLVNK